MTEGFYIHRRNWTTGRGEYGLIGDMWDSRIVDLKVRQ